MIIFLGGGPSQVDMIRALRHLGHHVCVVDRSESCPGRKEGDLFIHRSIWDAEGILRDITALNIAVDQDTSIVVSNVGGRTTLAAHEISNGLNLGFANRAGALSACNKSDFKTGCRDWLGRDFPFALIDRQTCDWREVVARIPGDLFIKPEVNIVGKQACRIVFDPDPNEIPALDFDSSHNGRLLVEPYHPRGRDLVVLSLVRHGKLLSRQIVEELNLHHDRVTNYGFCTAPGLDEELVRNLYAASESLIEAFEIENAPVAISFRVDGGDLFPVELHLDFGGENIFLLGCPFDLPEMLSAWLHGKRWEAADSRVHWSLYAERFTGWDKTQDLQLFDLRRVTASTGRVQWMFSLTAQQSAQLAERMELDV